MPAMLTVGFDALNGLVLVLANDAEKLLSREHADNTEVARYNRIDKRVKDIYQKENSIMKNIIIVSNAPMRNHTIPYHTIPYQPN